MALGERMKECRQRLGMSQEKVAELVGVSRQAVTKWETNQSAPNTENLFLLAEVFGTTVDMLLRLNEASEASPAEQMYRLYQLEEEKKAAKKRAQKLQNAVIALIVAAVYLCVYLLGRLLWCRSPETSFIGWIATAAPWGKGSYLYGWLLSSHLFWIGMAISVIPAFWGKSKFSFVTLFGFILGLLLGTFFGANPGAPPFVMTHYGWLIWGSVYVLSVITGILCQHFLPLPRRRGD